MKRRRQSWRPQSEAAHGLSEGVWWSITLHSARRRGRTSRSWSGWTRNARPLVRLPPQAATEERRMGDKAERWGSPLRWEMPSAYTSTNWSSSRAGRTTGWECVLLAHLHTSLACLQLAPNRELGCDTCCNCRRRTATASSSDDVLARRGDWHATPQDRDAASATHRAAPRLAARRKTQSRRSSASSIDQRAQGSTLRAFPTPGNGYGYVVHAVEGYRAGPSIVGLRRRGRLLHPNGPCLHERHACLHSSARRPP